MTNKKPKQPKQPKQPKKIIIKQLVYGSDLYKIVKRMSALLLITCLFITSCDFGTGKTIPQHKSEIAALEAKIALYERADSLQLLLAYKAMELAWERGYGSALTSIITDNRIDYANDPYTDIDKMMFKQAFTLMP